MTAAGRAPTVEAPATPARLASDGEPVIEVPAEPGPGTWYRDAMHFPSPLTPLGRSILYPYVLQDDGHLWSESGLLIDGTAEADIGGWHYSTFIEQGGGNPGRVPPAIVIGVLARLLPSMRQRTRAARDYIRGGVPTRVIDEWYERVQPKTAERFSELAAVDRAALADADLERHLDAAIGFAADGAQDHLRLFLAYVVELYQVALACRELVGWTDRDLFAALAGVSFRTSEPARVLSDLARRAAADERLVGALASSTSPTAKLSAVDRAYADAFEAYRWSYGLRTLGRDVGDPTLAGDPGLLARLIRDQVAVSFDGDEIDAQNAAQREALVATARQALIDRPGELERFDEHLHRGERAYAMREDNVFWSLQAPLGLIHHAALEMGQRLTDRGQLANAKDVFFVELDELRSALKAGDDMRGLVERRKVERRWVLEHPGPDRYGPEPVMPSLRWLPAESRILHEAFMWQEQIDSIERPDGSDTAGVVSGIGAAQGSYTGPVRVILDETQFGKMQAGDVIVCPVTQPTWSVLFPSMGAVVTDTGGILSHPAIIAREFRVPAVVGAGDATRRLHDGQIVTVDGTSGTVTPVSP